jgi:hypothetical protein
MTMLAKADFSVPELAFSFTNVARLAGEPALPLRGP